MCVCAHLCMCVTEDWAQDVLLLKVSCLRELRMSPASVIPERIKAAVTAVLFPLSTFVSVLDFEILFHCPNILKS